MTKQKLNSVKTKVLTLVEEGLASGDLALITADGQRSHQELVTSCLLQAVAGTKWADGTGVCRSRGIAMERLRLTRDEVASLEGGFEARPHGDQILVWEGPSARLGRGRTEYGVVDALSPLYRLGQEIRLTYVETGA